MYRHRSNFIALTSFFLGLMALTSTSVQADLASVSLGELIDQSDRIVIGVVTDVAQGKTPGEQFAAIAVEQVLLGRRLKNLSLRGSSTDPSLPEFHEGTRLLAFIRAGQKKSDIFEPVAGELGVMAIGDAAVDVTRDIVTTILDLGESISLRDVRYSFRRDSPTPPPGLVGLLLEELTLGMTLDDAPLVHEMACDARGSFYPVPQLWAINRAGTLKLSEARPCLEGFVNDLTTDRGTLVAAIQALGDLGDPKSVLVLQSLLPETQPLPAVDDGDDGDVREDAALEDDDGDTEPDGREDPEDETLAEDEEAWLPEADAWEELEQDPPPDDDSSADGEFDGDANDWRPDPGLTDTALLALGKIGAPEAIPELHRLAMEGDTLALHSTAVHALGLIGTPDVHQALAEISAMHPDELIRDQARRTLERLQATQNR